MHEFAIARGLVDAALAAAEGAGVRRVTQVRCRIGDLRQVDAWLLDEAFAVAREGTLCAEASLSVQRVSMEMDCPECDGSFEVAGWDWRCPDCGTMGVDARGGDELELTGIEGDVCDEHRSLAECVREE